MEMTSENSAGSRGASELQPVNIGFSVNRYQVLDHGTRRLRAAALSIVEAGISRGDPARGTHSKVRRDGDLLWVDGCEYDLRKIERIWVVGAGKASMAIASALEDILGDRIEGGVIVTKKHDLRRLRRIQVIVAGHPVPDDDSIRGARRMLEVASAARCGDIVFAPVTGGSSALASLPPEGVSLADLQVLNKLLLHCGEPIEVINVVRRHVCLVKGGRLAQAIQPALAATLTLDTAPEGMPWPDMCLPDPTTFLNAIAVLRDLDLWEQTPPAIRAHLLGGVEHPERETIKDFTGMNARMVFVGDPISVCDAAAVKAAELGFTPMILGAFIKGEAREVAIAMAGIAREILDRGRPAVPPCALISGGETTVTIDGPSDRGGPNQEFALAFAVAMSRRGPYACASLDTDGTDGPTAIAGGLTDDTSVPRAAAAGIDLHEALRRHATSEALERLGDVVVTGHTGTNLQNIRAIVLGDPRSG
jgi:glycerate-2-kinase